MPDEIQTKPFALDAKQFAWASFPALLPRLLPLWLAVIVLGTMAMVTVIKSLPVALLYVTVVASLSMLMHPLRTARALRKPRNRKVLAERTITVTPEEFLLQTVDGIEGKTPLREFDSVRLSNGLYLLELGARQFYPIPVNAFHSDGDRATFEQWAKASIPKVKGF